MLVNHSQAEMLLKEHKDGVPGFEHVEYELGDPDDNDQAELTISSPHVTPEAFAYAAGIGEATPAPPEVENLRPPQINGFPNVGQIVTADAGAWEHLEETPGVSYDQPRTWTTQLRWLYDDDEGTPAFQREDNGHGPQSYTIPAEALGESLVVQVTHGATTVRSEPFGPVEEALTEYPYPDVQPVADTDIVAAESKKTEATKTATERRQAAARRTRSSGKA